MSSNGDGKFLKKGETMKENTVKKPATKQIMQVQLSNWIVNNLSQFNLKPTAKLVLLYLASCYNPKHADIFPKQKTIADRMGISEASVIRAISELHKEGLVISERKYTNRYKFTSRILNLGGVVEDFLQDNNMQVKNSQNESLKTCNLQVVYKEQKEEQEKNNSFLGGNVYNDDKILEDYAIKHNAKNIQAYINTLKSTGSAAKIICEYKKRKNVTQNALYRIQETQRTLQKYKEDGQNSVSYTSCEAWSKLGEKLRQRKSLS